MNSRSLRLWVVCIATVVALGLLGCGSESSQTVVNEAPAPRPTHVEVERAAGEAALAEVRLLNRSRLALGLALHREVAQSQPEAANVVLSPASAAQVLSMLYAGARGATAEEIADALELPESLRGEALHPVANTAEQTLMASATADDLFTLRNHTAHFVDDGYPIKQRYLETLAMYYGSRLYHLPLTTEHERSRRAINEFVREHTDGLIDDLLEEQHIDINTRLVTINTLMFDAVWQKQFLEHTTRTRPFTTIAGDGIETPTMEQQELLRAFATGEEWLVGAKRYLGGYEMVVMLPPENLAFSDAVAHLNVDRVNAWCEQLDAMSPRLVDLRMPKVEMRNRINLQPPLQGLGMELAFVFRQADLSGISTRTPLHTAWIAQHVEMRIDELGTRAVAATMRIDRDSEDMAEPPTPFELHLDRPYFLLIREPKTNAPLFFGSIGDPRSQ